MFRLLPKGVSGRRRLPASVLRPAAPLLGWLAALLLTVGALSPAAAQVTGGATYTVPGSYPTIAAAITALNGGITGTGTITFNVAANYTETASGLLITATGTAATQVVFQKSGVGNNPKITATANVGVGTTDYIIGLSGSDYITFDRIDLSDANNAAATTAQQVEIGYALWRASATDGAQNNKIQNCVVTLNGAASTTVNANSIGIWLANATAAAPGTALTTTNTTTGPSSTNKFNGNTISGPVTGIYVHGGSGTAAANQDTGNEVGTTTGNTITVNANAPAYGVRVEYQTSTKTENNTITVTNLTASTATMRGIGYGATAGTGINGAVVINNNTITITAPGAASTAYGISQGGSSTPTSVSITANKVQNCSLTNTSGNFTGIEDSYNVGTSTITTNQIINNSVASTAGTFYGIYRSGSGGTVLIGSGAGTGNTISNNTFTGANGTLYCVRATTGVITLSSNTIQNNSFTSTSGTTSSLIYGYYNLGSPTAETVNGNTITGLSIGGTTTSTGNIIAGIRTNPISSTNKDIFQNTIGNLSMASTGGGTGGNVYGIHTTTGATVNVYRNKIYDLSCAGTGGFVDGLNIASGTTVNAYNNLIGNLTTPDATSLLAINGIIVGGGTTVRLYYNTVYVAASSTGTTFGTSGIYISSSTPSVDLRDNIIDNKSTAGSSGGSIVALRATSSSVVLASTSNNNLVYASCGGYLYGEGSAATPTNGKTTLATYKAYFTSPRETNSKTEDVPFQSTSGGGATFLHIAAGTPTQVEGGGTPITSPIAVANDYDNDTRNVTTPDIGADEGSFTAPVNMSVSSSTYTQQTGTSGLGSTSQYTTQVTVNATGTQTPLTVTAITFSTAGTAVAGTDIINAKVFVGGCSSTFSTTTQALPTTTAAGTFTVTFTTPVALAPGANTFFLTFDVAGGATAGRTFRAAATSVTLSTGSSTPTLSGGTNSRTIIGPLNGTYLVGQGQTAPNYGTLTAAIADLNTQGASGAVTFSLTNATATPYNTTNGETFPLTINTYTGNTFGLTIKPATGVQPLITGSSATALLVLNGADFVTVDGSNTVGGTTRDLTIYNFNGGTTSAVVWGQTTAGADAATNNTIKNVNVSGNSATTTLVGIGFGSATISSSSLGTLNNNNTIQNNAIGNVQIGIYSVGASAASKNTGTVITQNLLNNAGALIGRHGILVGFEDGTSITQNTVDGISFSGTGDVAGISAGYIFGGFSSSSFGTQEVTNATISRNIIGVVKHTGTYSAVGIALGTAATGTSTIANNAISGVSANATSGDVSAGIFVGGGAATTNIYFNSVSMTGSNSGATATQAEFALAIGGSNPIVRVKNNILLNTGVTGASQVAIGLAYSTYTNLSSDYNDFWVGATPGTAPYYIGLTGSLSSTTTGTLRNTLALWRTATGQDANSLSVDPQFTSTTNLYPGNAALAAGTPVGITVDITGATRSVTTPTIGAYELAATDLAANALVAPASGAGCYTNAEPVTVTIKNVGTAAINFATNNATITVNVTGAATQTFGPLTINSGTLTAGATQNVTLPGTLNMTANGTYTFGITATVAGDGNTSNDLLAPSPTRTVTAPTAGSASAATTAICGTGGTTSLTASGATGGVVTWYSSADGFTTAIGTGSPYVATVTAAGSPYTFKYKVVCATTSAFSSPTATVTVTNPLISTTNSPQTRCGPGTVTLTATGTGTGFRWYDTNVSTTVLASTASYSPSVTATRQYYVSATAPGGTENVGASAPIQSEGSSTFSDTGLLFTTTGPVTIQQVTVYNGSASAGTIVVNLVNDATSAVIATTGSLTLNAGSASALIPQTLTLNLAVPGAGTYRLVTPSTNTLYRGIINAAQFPYNSSSGAVSITNGYFSGALARYYNFYNWQVTSTCESPRTLVQVNVNTPPTLGYTGTNSYCVGGSTALTFSGTPATPAYTVTGISPTTNAAIAGNVITFSGASVGTTTYTVTANDGTGAAGCSATSTFTITVNPVPAAPTLTPSGNQTICSGGSVNVTASSASTSVPTTALSQNFNSTPTGWTVTDFSTRVAAAPAATLRWQRPPTPYTYINSTYTIDGSRFVVANSDTGASTSVTRTRLTSPAFSLAGYTTASLTFQQYFRFNAAGDSANVDVSLDGGTTWLAANKNVLVQNTANVGSAATPNSATVNLNAYAGQANVAIRFRYKATWGYYWVVDNVAVSGNYTVAPTYAITPASGVSQAGAVFTFNPTGTTSYSITASYPTAGGCVSAATPVTINVSAPTFTHTQTNVGCFGGATGDLTVNATGGIGTYQYSLNGGAYQLSNTFSGLAAGTYTVDVKDGVPCQATQQSVTITQPAAALALGVTSTDITCNGDNDGQIVATASNGTANYRYSIDGTNFFPVTPTAGSRTFSNLTPGSYTVTALDANGCTTTQPVTINEPTVLTFGTTNTDVTCNGAADGTITVTAAGGTGPYEFRIGAGAYTAQVNPYTFTGLAPGTHTIRVRDTNSCTAAAQFVVISQPTAVSFTATPVVTCVGAMSGTITVNASGGTPGYTYSNDNGATYQAGSTFTGLAAGAYQVMVKDANTCTAGPQTITVGTGTTLTWTGANSTDWFDASNWSPNCVPSATVNVIIPAGLTNYPVITVGTAIANNLTINSGGALTLSGGILELHGNWSKTGTFTQTGGEVQLAGTAQTIASPVGITTFYDLTVGAGAATLTGPARVARVLRLNGNLTTAGNPLTLLSDAATTGMIVNSGGVVVGNLTAQRYIDPSISIRDTTYRHMATPVTTTLGDLATNAPKYRVTTNPSWNTDTTALPFPTIFAYHESRVATAQMSPRFVAGYFSPAAPSQAMGGPKRMDPNTGQTITGTTGGELLGYSALMRDNVKPDFVGVQHNGNYSISGLTRGALATQGWWLLANPYPAPLDWSTVTNPQLPGMNGAISVLRSTDPNSANYVSYINGVGASQWVPMAQAYFMRVATVGGSGSVNLTNANRVTVYQNPTHYRTAAETRPLVKLTLVQSGRAVVNGDESYVYFEQGATAGMDQYYDAYKIRSTGVTPSLLSYTGGEEVSINGLPLLQPHVPTIVPLGVFVGVSGSYKLNAEQLLNFAAGTQVLLRDAVTGTDQDLTQLPTYAFTMDANYRGQRFWLIFNGSGAPTGLPGSLASQLAVYPNPVGTNSALTVRLNGVEAGVAQVSARLVDALGREVRTAQLAVAHEQVEGVLSTAGLSHGVYLLQLTAGQQTVTRQVVVE